MSQPLNPARPIIIIDDEPSILFSLESLLKLHGYNNVNTCGDSRKAVEAAARHQPELVLLDLTMPHVSGEELLPALVRDHPHAPVVVLTGRVDVESAVRCMRAGAYDYLLKPVDVDRLMLTIRRALELGRLRRENSALRQGLLRTSLDKPEAFRDIITSNPTMLAIFKYLESVATSPHPVLITGETGVGKELLARAVHQASGLAGPFVAVNVGGLDDNMFSDTLFGHAKGAYTSAERARAGLVERAKGGTLFMDEVGDLTPASQAKLLRLLQEGEYMPLGQDEVLRSDARIVASTNRNLWQAQERGEFRSDLNHRLRTHHAHVIPLRQRLDDLPLLLEAFLDAAARELGRPRPATPRSLVALLQAYHFPGNLRELKAMVNDAVSLHRGGPLSLEVFRHRMAEAGVAPPADPGDIGAAMAAQFGGRLPTLKEAGRWLEDEALRRCDGNQTAAAKLLGISQQALSKRLKSRPGEGHNQD